MMKCNLLTATTLTAVFALGSTAQAAIIYVDAKEGPSGNTVRASDGDDSAWVGAWNKRTVFANGGEAWEGTSGSTEPELKTSVTGLSNSTYDVWVFFWDAASTNKWSIDAGLTSGSLTTYSFDGGGVTAQTEDALSLTFSSAVLATEGDRILYGVKLGQVAGTSIDVFVGSSATGTSDRVWYDGIGYEAVPEPGSLALLGLGGLCMLKRRRRA